MSMTMTARMVSLMILIATMSFAAVAGAQDEPSGTDENGPPDYPPPESQQPPPAQGQTGPALAAPPAAEPLTDIVVGTPGQLVVSDDMQLALLRQTRSQPGGQSLETTAIQLRPAVDIFVAPNLSIGGQVRIEHYSADTGNGSSSTVTNLGLLPRIGYNVALSPSSSIWPRVALGYVHSSTDSYNGQVTSSNYTVTLEVFVPLVFQPVPHFFLGGGPLVSTDLVSKLDGNDGVKTTNIGLQSTIGGYFNL
jgi:hypothetical protein